MKKNYIVLLIASYLFLTSSAQWVQTNGPEGISVTALLNVSDSVLLCGTQAKGVYFSSDNGNSWMSTTGLENKWVSCFGQDSLYIYAGIFGATPGNEGVFRSSDNGHTWLAANTGIQNSSVTCLLVAGGYLFAGTGMGIFRSADQGNSWVDVTDNLSPFTYIHSMVYNAPRLTVEGDNYLWYSFTMGGNWNVDIGITAFYVIKNFYQHGDTLLANYGSILFRSTDGGLSWNGPTLLPHSFVGYVNINDTIYAGSDHGFLSSADFGLTWTFTPANGLRYTPSCFVISGNNFVYGNEEIGIYTSQDHGLNWQQVPLNNFTVASNINDAMIFDNGTVYAGTHGNGIYKTTDQGNTWTKIGTSNDSLSNENILTLLRIGPDLLLAGGFPHGLFRSADNGATWAHISNGLPPPYLDMTGISTLAQCGPNILSAMREGVFYSVDSGLTWLPTNLDSVMVNSTGGFAVRGNIACVGAYVNPPFAPGVYRSTDYGVSWSFTGATFDVDRMATGGGQAMYAGNLFNAFASYDDGLTWGASLAVPAGFTILAWDNYVFIGHNYGISYSNNYGASFTYVNQGLDPYPNNAVQGLTRDSLYVYAGFYHNGVWRRPLSDFAIITGTKPILGNNDVGFSVYPSLTSSEYTINYNLAHGSEVLIELTDYTGKLVKTVVSENKPVGKFTVNMNTNNLGAGVYLLNLKIDGTFLSTKKLVVTK